MITEIKYLFNSPSGIVILLLACFGVMWILFDILNWSRNDAR